MTCFFQSELFMSPQPLLLPQPLLIHPAGVKTGPAFVCAKCVPLPLLPLGSPPGLSRFPRSGLCRVQADVSCHPGGGCAAPSPPLISPSTKNSPVTQGDCHPPSPGRGSRASRAVQSSKGGAAGGGSRGPGQREGTWSHPGLLEPWNQAYVEECDGTVTK